MRLCYLVSQYPAPSHTFIRREIAELERQGFEVLRVSVRGRELELFDPADAAERKRTRYLLSQPVSAFAGALAHAVFRHPLQLADATAAALSKPSHRPRAVHLAYLAEAALLSRWLREHGVAHLHAHFGTNGAEVAMLAHAITGIPYSFTVHGPEEFDKPQFLRLPDKVARAAFVCAVSSFGRSQILRWLPLRDWRKVHVVRCGLDISDTERAPAHAPARDRFVCIGRLTEQKGHLVLLDALALLARRNVSCRVTLVGDGPLRGEITRRIAELGLGERVGLAGWLSNAEVQNAVAQSRALVLPSFAEGLPVALMEALALGRPAVTTYIAGIPELVDQRCGWLVPAGDAESLADAMQDCLGASDKTIADMGREGRQRVAERHDVARECARLARLFRAAAGESASPVRRTAEPLAAARGAAERGVLR